jgi:hypothetical protein
MYTKSPAATGADISGDGVATLTGEGGAAADGGGAASGGDGSREGAGSIAALEALGSTWFRTVEQVDEFVRNTPGKVKQENGLKAQLQRFKVLGPSSVRWTVKGYGKLTKIDLADLLKAKLTGRPPPPLPYQTPASSSHQALQPQPAPSSTDVEHEVRVGESVEGVLPSTAPSGPLPSVFEVTPVATPYASEEGPNGTDCTSQVVENRKRPIAKLQQDVQSPGPKRSRTIIKRSPC